MKGGSTEEQIKANLAYEILSDPIQRQIHDTYWKAAANKSDGQRARHTTPPNQKEHSQQSNSSSDKALSTFREKLEQAILARKAAIWSELSRRVEDKKEELQRQRNESRKTFLYTLGGGVAMGMVAMYVPIFWLGAAWLGYTASLMLKKTETPEEGFSLFGNNPEDLKRSAETLAAKQCHDDSNSLDRHMADFASIIELVMRSSSFDDSETHVARRITVALFLMGYVPSFYDSEARTITFTDQDERLVVRFRHRTGQPLSVTYVERLYSVMQLSRAAHGIVFCSPGLSDNATRYAQQHAIKCYTLESMNAWINKILLSDYSGPSGDILGNLEGLTRFIAKITPKIGRSYYRSRRP